MASCDDGSESDRDKSADEEVQTPVSRKKAKRKKTEGASGGTRSEKKRTSEVWDHFTRKKEDNDRAICNYCGKEMACATKSGTTSLKKHVNLACKSYQAWLAVNKDNTQGALDVENGNMRVCKVSESVFREATNEMMVVGELALSWVESVAWRNFCNKTKLYVPHSRRTATRDIVEGFVKKREEMKKVLNENKQRLSLTTDIWLAPHTGSSYMVITAHFIDSSWQLRKLIIGFKVLLDYI